MNEMLLELSNLQFQISNILNNNTTPITAIPIPIPTITVLLNLLVFKQNYK